MTDTTGAITHHPYPDVDLRAQPERITTGGIVLLTAGLPAIDGTFRVEWSVVGPVRLTDTDTRIALLGATTVTGDTVVLSSDDERPPVLRATLDTSPLSVGAWEIRIRLVEVGDDLKDDPRTFADATGIEVLTAPLTAGDDLQVSMRRAAIPPTSDQSLWVAIRRSTDALSFDSYNRFVDDLLCGPGLHRPGDRNGDRREFGHVLRRTSLPFPNVERYRLLKAATEVFLMIRCGVRLGDFDGVDLDDESRRLGRTVETSDLEAQFRDYLVSEPGPDGDPLAVLPYLGLIRQKLADVTVIGGDDEATRICYGILAEKLTNPLFIELMWSYWVDESGLMTGLGAISRRFQNRMAPQGRRPDPLQNMDVDPLRPLSNLLWAWIQDTQHRLTTVRRAYEYDHAYGLSLASRRLPPIEGADSRSRFVEGFHHLLAECDEFFRCDDNAMMLANGFAVLNSLKEVHLQLTQGAHNQYGDLPWTARHEMLMGQWMLSRPEVRDFLPTRTMVAYPENWMGPVESLNKLQGRDDTSVLHFRDLATFGEQILLGVRFGAWTTVIEPEQAANWARYWRAELQGYVHAYRAVTGIDVTEHAPAASSNGSMPAVHLRRRQGAYRG